MPIDAISGKYAPRVRGTQSLIPIIGRCFRRPSLLLTEVAWRWCAGIPTLWLLWHAYTHIAGTISADQIAQTGIAQFSLLDQIHATYEVMRCVQILWPPIINSAKSLVPLIMLIWAIASGLGRALVLARLLPTAQFSISRTVTIILLQATRVTVLTGTLFLWIAGARWSANWAIIQPMQLPAPDPNIVGFISTIIVLTIGLFTLWAIISWIFNSAPLLVIAERRNYLSSLIAAFRLGWLRGKLIEINLSLAVNKLALIVLAIVFCSTPLPFETVVDGQDLYGWWMFVFAIYFIASDFFHVVRITAYTELYRTWRESIPALATPAA